MGEVETWRTEKFSMHLTTDLGGRKTGVAPEEGTAGGFWKWGHQASGFGSSGNPEREKIFKSAKERGGL